MTAVKNNIKNILPLISRPIPNNINIINTNNINNHLYFDNLSLYNKNALQSAYLANHNWPFHSNSLSQTKFEKETLKLNIYNFSLKYFNVDKDIARNIAEYYEINTLTYFTPYLKDDIQVSLY